MSDINLKYIRGELSPNQYLELVLNEYDLSQVSNNCEGLAHEIRSTITTAFWKLDKLDRGHPFWKPGNGLPTINKLSEYSSYQVQHGIEVSFWSWVKICISYVYFADFLYPELWSSIENINVKWLVRTTWNYHQHSGSDSCSNLAAVLRSLGMESEAGIELNELSKLSKEAEDWVKDVKANLC
ncbi:MAG: hypothetical protein P8179_11645 [Candidatus Thiodiazotropha sp.]|jgi:hypothetical protein